MGSLLLSAVRSGPAFRQSLRLPRCKCLATPSNNQRSQRSMLIWEALRVREGSVREGFYLQVIVPELDLEVSTGSLGGLITTVEGLVDSIAENLKNTQVHECHEAAVPQPVQWSMGIANVLQQRCLF